MMENLEKIPDAKVDEAVVWQNKLKSSEWSILVLMLVLGLAWQSLDILGGILYGGLISILGFYQMLQTARQVMTLPEVSKAKRYVVGFISRLFFLGALIFPPIFFGWLNPWAMLSGLSVTLINVMFFGTLLAVKEARREKALKTEKGKISR